MNAPSPKSLLWMEDVFARKTLLLYQMEHVIVLRGGIGIMIVVCATQEQSLPLSMNRYAFVCWDRKVKNASVPTEVFVERTPRTRARVGVVLLRI